MKTVTAIPSGAYFIVTTGAYSDYFVRALFRASRELTHDELQARKNLSLWLTESGSAEELDLHEVCEDTLLVSGIINYSADLSVISEASI